MWKTSKILLSSTMIGSLLTVYGCGSQSSSSNQSDSSGSDQVTITYWSMWNKGEPQQKVLQNIMDKYTALHPNVKFDVKWSGRQVLGQVRNATNTGNVPDLVDQDGNEMTGQLLKDNLAEPLNDLLNKQIPNENVSFNSVFINGTLDQYKQNNNTYFIPYEMISSAFFYNKNQFSSLGVTPPKTWDDFLSLAKTIKSKGVAPLAEDGNIGFYNAYYFYWLSERINGTGAFKAAAGDKTGAKWDDPGFLQAAQDVSTLAKDGFFLQGYDGSQYPQAQKDWAANGKAAMILCGSWIPSETHSYATNFNYGSFPFPEVAGGKGNGSVESYLIGWSVPKGAKHVQAVEDFLDFAMQKDLQQSIVTDTANISTRKDLDPPKDIADVKNMIVNAQSFHPVYDGVDAAYPEWWKTIFQPLDDQLVFGKLSPNDFISQLKQKSTEYWAGK